LLVKPEACPRRKHLKGAPIGLALALPSNFKTRLERVSKDKPSSLLGLIVSDEGKKFYNIDTRGNPTALPRNPDLRRRISTVDLWGPYSQYFIFFAT
jgi:hypothetical protein